MALEDKMKMQQQEQGQGRLDDEEEQDLRIAVVLTQNLIDDGGMDVIEQAMSESNDPGQVIGQFLMQTASQLEENLPEGVQLSKRIYLAEGGWVEQISDYLQEQYDVPKKIMDRAEMYIGATADQMARGAQQRQQPGQPAEQPVQPQQAPIPMGGQ